MKPPRVIAHRGSSTVHPDNSWAAFEAAVAEGADAIECDVQATRDGALVVRHDLAICESLLADLSAAEVAVRAPGTVVLADLLAWAQRVRIDLLVEVKDPDATAAVAAAIAACAWRERIVLGGFHGPALASVKSTSRELRTSFMVGSVMAAADLVHLAKAYQVDDVHLCWESRAARPHRLLDRDAIRSLRDAGLGITLWHEEREDELRDLVALQPDAICTNTPAVLRHIVDADSNGSESEPTQLWRERALYQGEKS